MLNIEIVIFVIELLVSILAILAGIFVNDLREWIIKVFKAHYVTATLTTIVIIGIFVAAPIFVSFVYENTVVSSIPTTEPPTVTTEPPTATTEPPIATTEPPTVTVAPAFVPPTDAVYLESNIKSIEDSYMTLYPKEDSGEFKMNGVNYNKGIVSENGSSMVTYDIAEKGFTRITGKFGRVSDRGGTMTITGDDVLIDGYVINDTEAPISIDVDIPVGTGQVIIQFNNGGLGFGDGLFY